MRRRRPHDHAMAAVYRNAPAFALGLINGPLEDGDPAERLIALRQMAEVFGEVQVVSLAQAA